MSNDRNDYRGNPLDLIETLADVAGGLGDWIANGTPDSGSIAGEIQQRYRDHCDAWSNGPTWVQQIDPGARLFLSNACSPWLDSQGSGDPSVGSGPPIAAPGDDFTAQGGVLFKRSTAATEQEFFNCALRFEAFTGNNGNPSQQPFEIDAIRCDGSRISFASDIEFEIVSTGCCASQTNPPPPGSPVVSPNPNPRPDPGLDPEDEPFERQPGRPVLPMPEIPNPFGDPIQLPNFPLPNIEGPSLYPGDDIPGGDPTEPGDKGDPDPPVETAPGGEEEATDSSRWLMGILVEVTSAPSRAPGFQTSAGFVYTEAGFVYQGAGDELEYYEESERLLSGGQYFPAVRGYDTWRVVANPFYRLKVTPFYKERN